MDKSIMIVTQSQIDVNVSWAGAVASRTSNVAMSPYQSR